MEFIDLPRGDPSWSAALPVLQQLRSDLTAESLDAILAEGGPQGLRFSAVFETDPTTNTTNTTNSVTESTTTGAACLGVAGWRIIANTSTGRKLYVDDLVTVTEARSRGVGALMFRELVSRARAAGCRTLELDSGVQRFDAHRFYLRERMAISAHHFTLPL